MSGFYQQDIADNQALSTEERARFEGYEAQLAAVRQQLLAQMKGGSLPLLLLPENEAETNAISALAGQIRAQSKGLVVVGTGGSSLGGKTLCALSDGTFPVTFLENMDPHSMQQFIAQHDLTKLHLLVVSKSGGTMETICQSLVLLAAMEAAHGSREALKNHCHALSMPEASALRELAAHYGFDVLNHHPDIGGRFSVLSNVGLLPAAIAGLDIAAVQRGAASVVAELKTKSDAPPLLGAAWQAALMPTRRVSVLMPYCDRLWLLGDWYRQLWAESLGKGGHGSTPVRALGAVDQHSQLQLYLDGPKDKNFTLVTFAHAGCGNTIPMPPMPAFAYLGGKQMGDVMQALQEGTRQTLLRHHLPLREMRLQVPDEAGLGALLMHYMVETIACAALLGVNAFDQPAVEESKQLARAALTGKPQEAA